MLPRERRFSSLLFLEKPNKKTRITTSFFALHFWASPLAQTSSRFGVVVPARFSLSSVERTRLRRLVYALFREADFLDLPSPLACLCVPRQPFGSLPYPDLLLAFREAQKKLGDSIAEWNQGAIV